MIKQCCVVLIVALLAPSLLMGSPVMVLHLDEASGVLGDSTANANNATAGTGVTYGEEGVQFEAIGLHASTGQYLTVARNDAMEIDSRSFTIEMWAYQTPGQTSSQCVAGKDDRDGEDYTGNTVGHRLHLRIHRNATDYVDGSMRFGFYGNDLTTSESVFSEGAWHHLAWVYDYNAGTGRGSRYIYVDGEAVASQSDVAPYLGDGGATGYGNGTWYFGSSYSGGERLNGMLDEVRVYQDEALNATTVADHYAGRYSSYRPNATMVLHAENAEFGGPYQDVTPYANHAVGHGGIAAGVNTGISTLVGQGYALDGVDDYLTVASDSSNDINEQSFTLEMWAYQQPGATTNQCFASKNDNPTTALNNRLKCYVHADGKLHFGFWGNDSESASGAFTAGEWHHLAFVYDYDAAAGVGDRFIYLDGTALPITSSEDRLPYAGSGSDWIFGAMYDGPNWFLDGMLDEIRLYQLALAPAVIAQHASGEYTDFAPVPEPGSFLLLAAGVTGLLRLAGRRRRLA